MRLGGWTRIWIVLCVLYAAVVAIFAFDSPPSKTRVQRDWAYAGASAIADGVSRAESSYISAYDVKDKIGPTDEKAVAWLQQVVKSPRSEQRALAAAVKPINTQYAARLEQLPQAQVRHWTFALAWWLGGCALLFIAGWTIGWVFRGFRQRAA